MTEPALRYHCVAIALHWVIALLIITNLILGLVMGSEWVRGLPTDMRYGMYQWHKTFGVLVLLFTIARVYWRLTHRPPPLPSSIPKWERLAANATHILLYVFMFIIPLTGWLIVSASTLGIPTLLFGVIPWPHLPVKELLTDPGKFAHNMSEIHELLAFTMMALLTLHVAAALRHYFWLKDGILQRMLPALKPPQNKQL